MRSLSTLPLGAAALLQFAGLVSVEAGELVVVTHDVAHVGNIIAFVDLVTVHISSAGMLFR